MRIIKWFLIKRAENRKIIKSIEKGEDMKKDIKEENIIDNREIKENIADAALALLQEGEDYNELVNTKVEFGYLFDIEDHGLEALFKVMTDRTTAYFAVQGTSLMRLKFNEELFEATVDTFLDLHNN